MIEKKLGGLTASQLRVMLITSIGVIVVLGGIGFYFIQTQLRSFAVDVSHASEDAQTSVNDIATLQNLQKQLQANQANISRTASIVADSQSYQYQNQIITDLNTYANRAGVGITSYTFDSGTAGAATTTPGATAPAVAGLKATAVAVVVKSPTKYDGFMNFVHYIEQNLTKMQIASISLTKGQSADEVTSNALTIEVYIR